MTRQIVSPGRTKFLEEIEKAAGAVPPLHAKIPWASPHELYPLFSGPGSILFESVNFESGKFKNGKSPENIARHSFIVFEPYAVMRVKDGFVEIERDQGREDQGRDKGGRVITAEKDPLRRLEELVGAYNQRPEPGLPPFQGGAAGLVCYDFARYIERFPDARPPDELGLPDACFFMADRLLAFDHVRR
ncbi:MAG: hypothetical protein M0Z58_08300, partial [Nitrospiraceae bacterium]|nr:hypothetical protein [Nitrospiraceae bacterium]